MDLTCPYHQTAELIEDNRAGDLICKECGIVVGDRLVDIGSEWRTFNYEQREKDPSRVGAPGNSIFGFNNLATSIRTGFGASENSKELAKAQTRNVDPSAKQLLLAMQIIGDYSERINATKPVQDLAAKVYKQILDGKTLQRQSAEAKAAACLFYACRKEGVPRSYEEIAAVSTVTKTILGKCVILLYDIIKIRFVALNGSEYVPRFCGNLNLHVNIQAAATRIAEKADEFNLVTGRSPVSVAAASIYMASQASKDKRTIKAVAEMDEAILIDFDELQQVTYFEHCGVKLDNTNNCLFFKSDGLPQLTTSLNHIFIQKENFLCVMDEVSNHNYIVIFPDKTKCDAILEEINKRKSENGQNQRIDIIAEDNLFKKNFYIPILKEIQAGIVKADELRKTILKLVNSFEAEQRKDYMNLIFETSLNYSIAVRRPLKSDSFNDIKLSGNNDENNRSGIGEGYLNSSNISLNETIPKSYNLRKRSSLGCVKREVAENDESFGDNSFSRKRQRLSSINYSSNNLFVDVPYYKVIGFYNNGDITFRLIIFTSEERKYCYEFLYHRANNNYYCKNCKYQHVTMSVKIDADADGNVKFKFGKNQHICQPFEYLPSNYESNGKPLMDEKLIKMEEEPKKEL